MKKALPLITLFCYLLAIAGCIAHIILDIMPTTGMLIVFILYCLMVLTLMILSSHLAVNVLKRVFSKNSNKTVFEGLFLNNTPDSTYSNDGGTPLTDIFASDDAEEIVPKATVKAEPEAPEAEASSDNGNQFKFKEARYRKSYVSAIIQAPDETKSYYSTIKNAFHSYKKVTSAVSLEHERIRKGRTTLGIIKIRGKSVLVYLALDPAQLEGTMYVGDDVSSVTKYADVPFLYRVNGPRKAARAVKLIAMVAEKFGLESTPLPANEDYVSIYPYESTEELIEKGLIIDREAEAAKRSEARSEQSPTE